MVSFVYYAGATWLVIPGAKTFVGQNPGLLGGIAIWFGGAVLLAAPYALLWTANRRAVALRSNAAVLLSVLPPLGIIGIASPLTAAGFLFPGAGWLGVFGALVGIAALAVLRPLQA